MGLRERVNRAGAAGQQASPAAAKKEPLLEGDVQNGHPRLPEPPAQRIPQPPPQPSMVLDEIAEPSSSAPAPQPPARPSLPPGPVDLSEAGVAKMAPAVLISVAVAELRSRRIADEDGFMDARELRPLYKAVRGNNLMGNVFSELGAAAVRADALTREENAAPRTRRPPPPPPPRRSIPPPPSLRIGRGDVTGTEDTVASDQVPSVTRQEAAAAGAMALLPQKGAISKFLEELKTDLKPTTEQRLQKAREFYGQQLDTLHTIFGGDAAALKNVILAHQQSASEKRKRGEQLNRMEEHIMDLTRLSNRVQELEKQLSEEREFASLQAKKRSNLPDGGLQRIPSPDKDAAPQPPQSARPPPAAAGRLPSPERPAAKEAGAKEAEEGAAEKESEAAAAPAEPTPLTRKSRGRFARFMLSPVTWTVACVGGFTAAMVLTGGFDELGMFINMQMAKAPLAATYVRRAWEGWLHLPPLESAGGAKVLYYGLTSVGLAAGLWRKRRRVRKMVQELEAGIQDKERFMKMRNYVVPILAKIYEDYSEGTFPKKLRTKLIEDSRFFLYMDELYRSPPKFAFIMREAEVPPRQVAKFHVPFGDAENEIIKIRLDDYVHNIDDPGVRQVYLRETYVRDLVFRKKLDEVFATDTAGNYMYTRKQTDVAKALGNGEIEKGVPILKKLEADYIRLRESIEKR